MIDPSVIMDALNDNQSEAANIETAAIVNLFLYQNDIDATERMDAMDLSVVRNILSENEKTSSVAAEIYRRLARYRAMVENPTDVVVFYNRSGVRTYVSPAIEKLLGYTRASMLGRQGFSSIHPEDYEKVVSIFRHISITNPSNTAEFRVRHKNGNYIWVEQSFWYIPENDCILTISRSIDARKTVEAKLAETRAMLETANLRLMIQAGEDALTGLYNRRFFDEVLNTQFYHARREQTNLSVMMIDVDCFKKYNDTYGHVAGDECIRRVSEAIKKSLLRPNDLAARYGGEEFAVIAPGADEPGSINLADRIRQAVEDLHIEHTGNPYGIVTISVGVYSAVPSRDATTSAIDFVTSADSALYRAKESGRNCIRACQAVELVD
ncbi:unnamed protein product [Sphagnum tenellum]